jgi:hypothetical protein
MPAHKRADRTAVMQQAHRIYFSMNWRSPSDWDWPRCLRLAHASEAERKKLYATHQFAELEREMKRVLAEQGQTQCGL